MHRSAEAEPTFIEHVHELRSRLIVSILCMVVGTGIGWSLFGRIVELLSRPFRQTLYYSAPTGELSFTIKVSVVFGVIVAAPMIFYQILGFIKPVLSRGLQSRILLLGFFSAILAACGVAFAYFISLPLTLQFLINVQGGNNMIQPLISADEYFNFVLAYIAGFAVLFQIPLFVLIINKITPLTPTKLFKSFRFVIIFSFIAAAIITPTPDPINQAIMAIPVITLYFISAALLVVAQLFQGRSYGNERQFQNTAEAIDIKAKIPEHLLPANRRSTANFSELVELLSDHPLEAVTDQATPALRVQKDTTAKKRIQVSSLEPSDTTERDEGVMSSDFLRTNPLPSVRILVK